MLGLPPLVITNVCDASSRHRFIQRWRKKFRKFDRKDTNNTMDALADGCLDILADPRNPDEIRAAIHASLGKMKWKPPEGLEEFSLSRFKDRVWRLLAADASRPNHNDPSSREKCLGDQQ